MNARIPSLDAAAYYGDRLAEADELARQKRHSVVAARTACDAIKAIPAGDFTEAVVAQIASVLSARIAESNFAHIGHAPYAMQALDEVHDLMGEDLLKEHEE